MFTTKELMSWKHNCPKCGDISSSGNVCSDCVRQSETKGKPMIYSAKLSYGETLVEAETYEKAVEIINDEFGKNNVKCIDEATDDQVAWVKAMGGKIHTK